MAMIEIRRILCPVDLSDCSRRAVHHAVAVARWYKSSITALRVFSPVPTVPFAPGPVAFEPAALLAADRDQLLAQTRAFAAREAAPGIDIDAVIREGDAATEILACARDLKPDLLVMGTHGRSGFERLIIGSVTEKVLRRVSAPVLTVPRGLPDALPAAPALFREILCPIDFSSSSLQALRYAMSIAQESDARIAVLHVVAHEIENAADAGDFGALENLSIADFRKQRDEELRERLADVVPAGVASYCGVNTMLTHGKPWREILRAAAERRSDLIVMGVQGRGVADLMFFGSTTHHVVRQATCPVLTIRAQP
jgi:nucleotide-binding universal stress UspA family protein